MSREQYQVPTAASPVYANGDADRDADADADPGPNGDALALHNPLHLTANALAAEKAQGPVIFYLCGECGDRVPLERGDPIRCKDCGHRVLYKERTKRMVQFEAR
ncbi:MAG: DNA-directed RNA polymerase core subunit rpc10 [Phylliscum demangeonii]|nr:MAG: DNA-directed RNA polymerase core subunit rpc10 [Phylliscum demangeonii]